MRDATNAWASVAADSASSEVVLVPQEPLGYGVHVYPFCSASVRRGDGPVECAELLPIISELSAGAGSWSRQRTSTRQRQLTRRVGCQFTSLRRL